VNIALVLKFMPACLFAPEVFEPVLTQQRDLDFLITVGELYLAELLRPGRTATVRDTAKS
jgi:hypothetical protein